MADVVCGKFTVCEPDDPKRCQGADGVHGQCKYKSVEGQDRCPRHIGVKEFHAKKKATRNYRIAAWQGRMEELADNEGVKSLREEIALLRIIVETFVNRAKDEGGMDLYSPRITDTIMKLEKLISSCHRIEASSGHLLDKSSIITLAARIVDIVGIHVTDEDQLDRIGNDIMEMIAEFKPEGK